MIRAQLISINHDLYIYCQIKKYMTINIGNPRMTHELLKGNLCTLMYVGCNVDSRVQYVSCNGGSHVRNSTLRRII